MSSVLPFPALIESIARAVAQAQDAIEKHQVGNLLAYFDEHRRPRSIVMQVPSLSPQARPGDEEDYRVPLLSLVPVNVLKIKDVKVRFAVDIGDVEAAADGGPAHVLNVATRTGSDGGRFQVTLRVEGSAPSEGASRLLDMLARMQGVYPPVEEGEASPAPTGGAA